jgi:hypothetical protein
MNRIIRDPQEWKSDDEALEKTTEQFNESNTMLLWNSYVAGTDYCIRYKQIFSIFGFICIERSADDCIKLIESLIEVQQSLLNSPYRVVRFVSLLSFVSLFRSMVTSLHELEDKIHSLKKKKLKGEQLLSISVSEAKISDLKELIGISFEFIIFPKSIDISPVVREEIYSIVSHYIESHKDLQIATDYTLEALVLKSLGDTDRQAKLKAIELTEKFISKKFNYKEQSETDDFYDDVFKILMSNIVNSDTSSQVALVKVLKTFTKYYKPLTKGDYFKLIKKFIFHTNPVVSRNIVDIICQTKAFTILDIEKGKIAEEVQHNFSSICEFLDDTCFNDYEPAEIGEYFAKVMISCKDTTLFNFKLYGVLCDEHENKKNKSKKKNSNKHSLPQIFMYILKHVCQYLKAYIKINQVKLKVSQEEYDFYISKEKNMNVELLQTLSIILNTYRIDDPIVDPALKLFEVLDFKSTSSEVPSDDLAHSVCDSILKLHDMEEDATEDRKNVKK